MSDLVVSLQDICISFSGVQILKNVNLDLKKGEIHAVVGENGAGKSTLMKILMGIYQKTSGTLCIDGEEIQQYDVNLARKKGIQMIPQELALVPAISVGENIMMGVRNEKKGFVNLKELNKAALPLLEEINCQVDPSVRVDSLPISYRQMISIAKAIAEEAKVIIMDEPTSSLSKEEIGELMRIIFELKEKGTTIIYISHLLDEIFTVADRITVLRDGEVITTLEKEAVTQRELVSYMVGEDLLAAQESLGQMEEEAGETRKEGIEPVLSVKKLLRKGMEEPISLDLYPGEIVGITGLIGSGKTEFVRALFGLEKVESGSIFIDGKEVQIRSPKEAYENGMALVPEDRRNEGLVLIRDVKENISMNAIYRRSISRLGFLNKSMETENAKEYVNKLKIKIAGLSQRTKKLSGGNQQKIVISKALLSHPKILVMDEPTRGIDVGAKKTIYDLLHTLKEQGMSVLYFSSDVAEMSFVGERIMVMREGTIVKQLPAKASVEQILDYVAGGAKSEEGTA